MSTPTQVRRPWTTTLRTFVQTLIGAIITLGVLVPAIVEIILNESGDQMPADLRTILLAVSGFVALIASIVARIMAIPQVELLLRRYKITRPFAAQPKGRTLDVQKRSGQRHLYVDSKAPKSDDT
jgi:hypothetical protein